MNDTNSNEGQLPEDAAVTVTSADTLGPWRVLFA